MQAQGEDSPESAADSGLSSLESFARWDPASWSWRTSQRCLLEGLTPFSGRWPRSGTMQSGAAFARPTWALATDAIGCLSSQWPTPGAMDGSAVRIRDCPESWIVAKERHAARGVEKQYPLQIAAELNLSLSDMKKKFWPTPDASVANLSETLESWLARRERVKAIGINGNGMGTPLAIAVRWPTPTAGDAKASGAAGYSTESGRHAGTTLTDAVNGMWATPVASDEKGPTGAGRTSRRKSPQVPDQAGCRGRQSLNPAWVEQLMGFPPGWTLPGPDNLSTNGRRRASSRLPRIAPPDSAPSATPSSRKSRKRSDGTRSE